MFENLQIDANLPDISNITFKRIHKNYLKLILINIFITSIILFVGLYFLIENKLNDAISEYTYVLYIILGILITLITFFSIIGFYKRKYAVREKDISYRNGVLFHKLTTVPFSRIQHVEIYESPISRLLKLSTLNIFTAGESGNDLKIKGLPNKEAEKIKQFITDFLNGEHV